VKTNASVNEVVDDSDLISKLRLESAKAKFENRKLEDRLRKMEDMNANAIATQRELDNLKKFVFSERSSTTSVLWDSRRRLSVASNFHTDESTNLWVAERRPANSSTYSPTSKCDLHIGPSSDQLADESFNGSGNILRVALETKAKQVKHLKAKLLKPSRASRDKRYSLISETRQSFDVDRRISLIKDTRSPDDDKMANKPKPQCQDIDYYQSKNEHLESKLSNSNSLIEGLEHQIDELISQKNDALVSKGWRVLQHLHGHLSINVSSIIVSYLGLD
jgi:hypothetical protein